MQWQTGHLGLGEAVVYHREDRHRHWTDSGEKLLHCLFVFFNKKRFSWWCLVTHSFLLWPSVIKHNRILKGIRHSMLDLYLCFRPCPVPRAPSGQLYETVCWRAHLLVREAPFCNVVCLHDKYKDKETDSVSWRAHLLVIPYIINHVEKFRWDNIQTHRNVSASQLKAKSVIGIFRCVYK